MKLSTPVAVTSRSFSRNQVLRAELTGRYDSVRFNEEARCLSRADLIGFLKGFPLAITALEQLDEEFFAALPDLRVVSKFGVGLDMIDLAAMEQHGVHLGWTPGINRRSVAEMTVSAMIALLHRLPEANLEVRRGIWRQIQGRQLSGRTVGIVGCGHVGKEVGLLLQPFGCRLLANDLVDFPEYYANNHVTPLPLDDLLRRAEVLTLHLPLDKTTRNILPSERLDLLPHGAVIVNYARGGLLDDQEILRRLRTGRLGGAAFDVFFPEPPTDSELLNLPNFLASPHIGGSTEEAVLAMGRAAIDGLERHDLPSRLRGLKFP